MIINTGARAATPKPETPPAVISKPETTRSAAAAAGLKAALTQPAEPVADEPIPPAPALDPSNLHIFPDVVQGSEEWHAQRRGLVTASVVGLLVTAKTLKPAANDTSRGLAAMLTAERITGYTEPTATSRDMERGKLDEPYARNLYSETYEPAHQVGFMVRDDFGFQIGYSPDGLVGDDGLIEIKSRAQKKHLLTVLANEVPAENIAQIQCGLLVSGRAWCDYVSYCGGMALWVKRVYPDPAWHEAIVAAVKAFEDSAKSMILKYESATHGAPIAERIDHFLDDEIVI